MPALFQQASQQLSLAQFVKFYPEIPMGRLRAVFQEIADKENNSTNLIVVVAGCATNNRAELHRSPGPSVALVWS